MAKDLDLIKKVGDVILGEDISFAQRHHGVNDVPCRIDYNIKQPRSKVLWLDSESQLPNPNERERANEKLRFAAEWTEAKKFENADTWSKRFSKMTGAIAAVCLIIAKNIGLNFCIGLFVSQLAETIASGRQLYYAFTPGVRNGCASTGLWTIAISALEFLGNILATVGLGLVIALQVGLAGVVGGAVGGIISLGLTAAYAFKAFYHFGMMLGYIGYGLLKADPGSPRRKASFELARQQGASCVAALAITAVTLGFNALNILTGGLAGPIVGFASMAFIAGVAAYNRVSPIGAPIPPPPSTVNEAEVAVTVKEPEVARPSIFARYCCCWSLVLVKLLEKPVGTPAAANDTSLNSGNKSQMPTNSSQPSNSNFFPDSPTSLESAQNTDLNNGTSHSLGLGLERK